MMAAVNKDSRFPLLYDDPYEEPPVSLASTPPSELPANDSSSQPSAIQEQTLTPGVNGTVDIPDNRPPGDGASARRDMPPLSIVSVTTDNTNDDDDEAFHSPCAEIPSSSMPPPLAPRR